MEEVSLMLEPLPSSNLLELFSPSLSLPAVRGKEEQKEEARERERKRMNGT